MCHAHNMDFYSRNCNEIAESIICNKNSCIYNYFTHLCKQPSRQAHDRYAARDMACARVHIASH